MVQISTEETGTITAHSSLLNKTCTYPKITHLIDSCSFVRSIFISKTKLKKVCSSNTCGMRIEWWSEGPQLTFLFNLNQPEPTISQVLSIFIGVTQFWRERVKMGNIWEISDFNKCIISISITSPCMSSFRCINLACSNLQRVSLSIVVCWSSSN